MTDFAMFTKAGNERVATIVKRAKANNWNESEIYRALFNLSRKTNKKGERPYGEATDTAVREEVYFALGLYE